MAKKIKRTVHEPHDVARRISPNISVRTSAIDTVVWHDTESHDRPGNADVFGMLDWFCSTASQVSIHKIVAEDGASGTNCPDNMKAWHCVAFNSRSLGIEMIGLASYTKVFWSHNHRKQLVKVAKITANWCKVHKIPVRDARKGGAGIRTHASLGLAGGGHTDPGTGFPFLLTLGLVKFYSRRGWSVK